MPHRNQGGSDWLIRLFHTCQKFSKDREKDGSVEMVRLLITLEIYS